VRARPLALSLVVHAVLLALIAQVRRRGAQHEQPIEVELAEAPQTEGQEADAPEPEPPSAAEPSADEERAPTSRPARPRPADREGGGGGGTGESTAAPAEPAADGDVGEPSAHGLDLGWSLGGLGSGGGAGGAGGAGGKAGGTGGGAQATRRARPAPRKVSKARPPRLVYPKRVRDERDGDVFVAVVTIDEGGWVVGVRLVQGVSPYADQKALDAAWRLHYDPALDDSGRPIRARVEQRFMVE